MVDFNLYQTVTLVLRVVQILVTAALVVMTVYIAKKSYLQQKTPEIDVRSVRKAKDYSLKLDIHCTQGKAKLNGYNCSVYKKIEEDGSLQSKMYEGFKLMPNVSEELPVVIDHGDSGEFELSSLPCKADDIEEINLELHIMGHRSGIFHLNDF